MTPYPGMSQHGVLFSLVLTQFVHIRSLLKRMSQRGIWVMSRVYDRKLYCHEHNGMRRVVR
jgi:hypothetical protein